ncbi:MAG: cell division protein ZapA [Pseudomonadota bacterium]
MPEVTITIGGRDFEVACQEGEEQYLQTAAKMLDDEAKVLAEQVGRMPEARMLLMAGLMLAAPPASVADPRGGVRALGAARAPELEGLRNAAPAAERVEVPVVPQAVTETMAELAARAEAIAAEIEERSGK